MCHELSGRSVKAEESFGLDLRASWTDCEILGIGEPGGKWQTVVIPGQYCTTPEEEKRSGTPHGVWCFFQDSSVRLADIVVVVMRGLGDGKGVEMDTGRSGGL